MKRSMWFLVPRPTSPTVLIKILLNDVTTYYFNIRIFSNSPKALIQQNKLAMPADWKVSEQFSSVVTSMSRKTSHHEPWRPPDKAGLTTTQHTGGETYVCWSEVISDPLRTEKNQGCVFGKKDEKKGVFMVTDKDIRLLCCGSQIHAMASGCPWWKQTARFEYAENLFPSLPARPYFFWIKQGSSFLTAPRGRWAAPMSWCIVQDTFPGPAVSWDISPEGDPVGVTFH